MDAKIYISRDKIFGYRLWLGEPVVDNENVSADQESELICKVDGSIAVLAKLHLELGDVRELKYLHFSIEELPGDQPPETA